MDQSYRVTVTDNRTGRTAYAAVKIPGHLDPMSNRAIEDHWVQAIVEAYAIIQKATPKPVRA